MRIGDSLNDFPSKISLENFYYLNSVFKFRGLFIDELLLFID
jgi:hypothetical protein